MSRAPRAKQQADVDEYIASWHATMQLLREGKSFSGREKNCVFLNCGGSQFANVSSVTGLDFPDDGRAIASVDWDQDGDLDLWIQNRTGPRLRFMRNQTRDASTITSDRPSPNFVALQLQGVNSNRDAIGARAFVRGLAKPLVQSVRAGDGYLSQSSKWLHFGLGDNTEIEGITVHWPNGDQEEFSSVQVGKRYTLVQGTGIAELAEARKQILLATQPQPVLDSDESIRAMIANPVPLPILEMAADRNQTFQKIQANQHPLLIVLWASWCPNCLEELTQLATRQPDLEAAKLDVLALNVDALATDFSDRKTPVAADGTHNSAAADLLRRIDFPYEAGYATLELMDKWQIVQRIVLNRPLETAIPTMLLVNRHNELTGIYQGAQSIETLLDDANKSELSVLRRRDRAVPFPGTWTTPPDVLLMRPVANVFREAGYRSDYERFLIIDRQRLARLRTHATNDQQRQDLEIRFANDSLDIAQSLLESGRSRESLDYFREGLERVPNSAKGHFQYGRALQQAGRRPEAAAEFESTLELSPAFYQASFELGVAAASNQQLETAVNRFRKVLETRPDHVGAWTNLGVVLARMKQPQEAIDALQRAARLDKTNLQAWLALGGQLAVRRDFKAASNCFRKVTELDPKLARGHAALGQSLTKLNDDVNAAISLQRAIALDPRDAGSKLQLAFLQSTSPVDAVRDGAAAVKIGYELAKQTANRDPRVLDVLGAAMAETGDFENAIRYTRMAMERIPANHPLQRVMQSRINEYQQDRPFRQVAPTPDRKPDP